MSDIHVDHAVVWIGDDNDAARKHLGSQSYVHGPSHRPKPVGAETAKKIVSNVQYPRPRVLRPRLLLKGLLSHTLTRVMQQGVRGNRTPILNVGSWLNRKRPWCVHGLTVETFQAQ
jgi:hypothetical protein